MRALVTGGTGFVGSHLLDVLVREGHEVRALARSAAKARALGLQGVRWIEAGLDSETALTSAADSVDVVFHVAGLVAARSEAEFLAVNRDATARLLRAAAPSGARFVLVSSLAAGGPSTPGVPLRGDEPPRPVTIYGRSKLAAEEIVREGPLPWTIIRPPTVYGPREREVLRIFRMARWGVVPAFGDGSQELSLVFGPDLAAAMLRAALSETAAGGIYYAAHREMLRSDDLVRAIGAAVGRRVRLLSIPPGMARGALAVTEGIARVFNRATLLTTDKANEFLAQAWTCDPSALERDTGWSAGTGLPEGLARTVAWYREAGWL